MNNTININTINTVIGMTPYYATTSRHAITPLTFTAITIAPLMPPRRHAIVDAAIDACLLVLRHCITPLMPFCFTPLSPLRCRLPPDAAYATPPGPLMITPLRHDFAAAPADVTPFHICAAIRHVYAMPRHYACY